MAAIIDKDWLAGRAMVSPQKIGLIYESQQFSYAQLNDITAKLCSRLAGEGIKRGEHIAVLMPNRVEYICLIHAAARMGTVLVPLNIRLTEQELRQQLEQTDCHYVICLRETESIGYGDWQTITVDNPQKLPPGNYANWHSRPLELSATQAIIHTSGTTGQPKGAMLTYNNQLWSATASAFRLGVEPLDRWLLCMPLYHVGGQAIVLRCCLYGTTIILQNRFNPNKINNALNNEVVSQISLVPTMLQLLLEERGEIPLPSTLRLMLLGGAKTPLSLIELCHELKIPLAVTYGLTEAASQVTTATTNEVKRKPGSVGKPLMFGSVRIVDGDGIEKPSGEIGQIIVHSPTVMAGYYRQPQITAQTVQKGELYTSDLGYLDEDGDLWLKQRRTDLIVSGGENIYPAEIEQVLLTHPAIKMACVVGLDDDKWGQSVGAVVQLQPDATLTEKELIAFCRTKLAGYKQPRLLRFLLELPLTASGKIKRADVTRLLKDNQQS